MFIAQLLWQGLVSLFECEGIVAEFFHFNIYLQIIRPMQCTKSISIGPREWSLHSRNSMGYHGPLYHHGSTLIPVWIWISNRSQVLDEITHLVHGSTAEVCNGFSNFTPTYKMDFITYPCWNNCLLVARYPILKLGAVTLLENRVPKW